jgi:serine/threonine protein kinase/Tol biopolymer transport system component
MALTSGTKLGPYEIQSPLGAGGMGEVYRARDTRLDRIVAIKVLTSHLSDNPELKQRFEREAKAISSLNHPNICTLHDVGSQNGVDFLVMEHLEGETLAQRMRKGPLPLDQVVKVGCEIADALDKAHRAGIVHRDLKPGNVMLTKAGTKLLDFGLAKPLNTLVAASGSAPLVSAALTMSSPSPQLSPLTSHGTIVGTMQYMSPEQIEGREADARSDIFALGAVLYEMATGKRAFEGKSQLTVASAILEKDPQPISTLRASVTPALAHVIDGCLNKDPEQRWQSAGDISRELKWISNAAPEAAIASTPRPAKQALVYGGVAALLLIATIVLAVKLLTRTPTEQWKLQSDSEKHDVVDAEYAGTQLSADGSKLAFVAADAHSAIFVRDLRTGKLDQLKGTEGAAFPFWSPDGRALGFFASQQLRTVSLDQGMVQTLCDAPGGRGGTWNTDGQIVFTPNISDPLYVVSDSGGTPKAVTPATAGGRSDRVPFFLPDQKHFLYIEQFTTTSNQLHASYDILVGSVDGTKPRKVLSGEYDSPQFAEGKLLYGRGRSLYAQDFSLSSFQVSGKPVKIADDVNTYHGRAVASFSVSNSGLLAYRTSPVRFTEVVWLDRSGRIDVSFPATEKGWGGTFDVAHDSSKALFCESDQSAIDTCSTWMLDFGSKAFSKLPLELLNTQAVFTSGLEAVVYVDNTGHLKKYSFTSGATEDFGVQTTDYSSPVDVTPQGDVVLTVQRQQTGTGNDVTWMTLKPLSKMRDIVATPREEYGQKLSPNGKWLPYCFDEGGVTNLSVAAFPAGRPQWQLTTAGGCQATWSADGHELYFVSDNKVYALPVKDPNNFEPVPTQVLFEIPTNITGGRMMPDGKHFLGFRATGATRGGEINVIVNWRVSQSR